MSRDEALMLVRLAMQAAGGVLVYRGIVDDVLLEAMIGMAMNATGAVWSWRARKALRSQVAKLPETVRKIAVAALGTQNEKK